MKKLAPLVFIAALVFSLDFLRADPTNTLVYVWTNTAGGNWSNPNNWTNNFSNLHQVPGQLNALDSPDDVQITAPGTYTVVLDEGADPNFWDIHSLTLGAGNGNGVQTLVVSNKILYANPLTVTAGGVLVDSGASFHVGAFVQNGGQILSTNGTWFVAPLAISSGGQFSANGNYAYDTFHGNVVVDAGGLFSVASGLTKLANDASLTVAANGELDIPGNGYFYLQGPLTNSGMVYLVGNINGSASVIAVDNDGTPNYKGGIWNLAGGIVHLNSVNGYSAILTDYGAGSYFINQGVILGTTISPSGQTISVARFDNSGGVVTNLVGTMDLSTFTNTLAGIFYATNGAAIQFNGGTASAPLKPGAPLALLGGGQFRFNSGWLDLTNDIIPNLQLARGTLELEPTFQGGAITNLALNGITLTNLALPVTNGLLAVTNSIIYGNCFVQNGGRLITASDTTIHGNLDVQAGGLLTVTPTVIPTWLNIPADSALTIEAGGEADVSGNATIDLRGPATNSGTLNLLGNNGGLSGIFMENDGSGNYRGSLWNQPGGIVRLNGVANGYSVIQIGYGANTWFLNQGTLTASLSGMIEASSFTNAGDVTVLTGTLQLNDNNLVLQPASSLNVRLNSKSDYGKIAISGPVALTGTLGVTLNGTYVPAVGDSFTPLTYGSYSGAFTATNLPPLVAWRAAYGATAVTVSVAQAGLIPEFTTAVWSGGNLIFSGTNGAPGSPYWVLSSTNLAVPLAQWTPVFTNNFDANGRFSYTNVPGPTRPQQFFILKLQ
jgi:hypothetical protein